VYPTGLSPVGKRDPPELPNIFRGTTLQWRRCVRTGTSTAPWTPKRGGLTGKVDISLEMGPVAHLWLTYGPLSQHRKNPTSL
jgi:hypothetical protein